MTPDLTITLIIVVLLILISGFFSCAETALMSSSKPKIHALKKESKKAQVVEKFLNNPRDTLSTILLGNNLANIAASSLAAVAFTKLFGTIGVAYATFLMTFLVLIFAEILPKTLAALAPEKTSMAIIRILELIYLLFKPFIFAIDKIISFAIFILGLKHIEDLENFNEDDIKGAIGMGLKTGVLEKSEHQMLDSIVDFDTINAEDIMQHRVNIKSIEIGTKPDKIFKLMKKSPYNRIPVYKKDSENIVGILYSKEFFTNYTESISSNKEFNIQQILKPAVFVPETTPLPDLLIELKKTRSHMRFVVNEYGELQGLLTLEDILEEIVGEIEDEFDESKENYTVNKDKSITISGMYPIRDCNRNFDWDLPEENHITLSGFIIGLVDRVPKKGETINYNNLNFTVQVAQKQSIKKLTVSLKNKPQKA